MRGKDEQTCPASYVDPYETVSRVCGTHLFQVGGTQVQHGLTATQETIACCIVYICLTPVKLIIGPRIKNIQKKEQQVAVPSLGAHVGRQSRLEQ